MSAHVHAWAPAPEITTRLVPRFRCACGAIGYRGRASKHAPIRVYKTTTAIAKIEARAQAERERIDRGEPTAQPQYRSHACPAPTLAELDGRGDRDLDAFHFPEED